MSLVSRIPGRKRATDAELLEAYKGGMFLNQIRSHYQVGLARLRRIVRTYEKETEGSS